MPKPPKFDSFTDAGFITNYYLAGCSPPSYLVVDYAGPPFADLALLFIGPSWDDIVQTMLEPKGGRKRRPGRHGRKRKGRRGFPDPNDLVGKRLRGTFNPHDAFNFGPFRKVWPLWNAYEGVSFAAAVVEGVTDVGFENLYGILHQDKVHCREFARLSKTNDGVVLTGGAGSYFQPFGITDLQFTVNFFNGSFGTRCSVDDYTVGVKVLLRATHSASDPTCRLALSAGGDDVVAESFAFTAGPGETQWMEVSVDRKAGEDVFWGVSGAVGFFEVLEADVIGFANVGIFQ